MKTQYDKIKENHPDCVILFRKKDFYVLYEDDAVIASRDLGITLSKRDDYKTACFPFHALDDYLPRLIRNGHRVCITDEIDYDIR